MRVTRSPLRSSFKNSSWGPYTLILVFHNGSIEEICEIYSGQKFSFSDHRPLGRAVRGPPKGMDLQGSARTRRCGGGERGRSCLLNTLSMPLVAAMERNPEALSELPLDDPAFFQAVF